MAFGPSDSCRCDLLKRVRVGCGRHCRWPKSPLLTFLCVDSTWAGGATGNSWPCRVGQRSRRDSRVPVVDVDSVSRTAVLGRPARAVCAGRAAGRAFTLAVCAARSMRSEPGGPGDVPPGASAGSARRVCLTDVLLGSPGAPRYASSLAWCGLGGRSPPRDSIASEMTASVERNPNPRRMIRRICVLICSTLAFESPWISAPSIL